MICFNTVRVNSLIYSTISYRFRESIGTNIIDNQILTLHQKLQNTNHAHGIRFSSANSFSPARDIYPPKQFGPAVPFLACRKKVCSQAMTFSEQNEHSYESIRIIYPLNIFLMNQRVEVVRSKYKILVASSSAIIKLLL